MYNNFTKSISNETSLAQNFANEGNRLDQLFENSEFNKIVDNWKRLLLKMIEAISRDYDLNMKSINSMAAGRGYDRFHIDLEGHISDKKIQDCLKIRDRTTQNGYYLWI